MPSAPPFSSERPSTREARTANATRKSRSSTSSPKSKSFLRRGVARFEQRARSPHRELSREVVRRALLGDDHLRDGLVVAKTPDVAHERIARRPGEDIAPGGRVFE